MPIGGDFDRSNIFFIYCAMTSLDVSAVCIDGVIAIVFFQDWGVCLYL